MLKKTLFQLFLSTFSLFSFNFLHLLGKLLGNVLFLLPGRAKKVSQINISYCFPNKTQEFKKNLCKHSLIETSKALLESPKVWNMAKKSESISFITTNENLVRQSLNQNKGVIVFTPHLGNMELVVNYGGTKFNSIIPYRKAKIDFFEKKLKELREFSGAQMVPTSLGGVRSILKSLKKGRVVIIASDQVPTNKKTGVLSTFFGAPSLSTSLVQSLASSVGSPVFSLACIRKEGGLFEMKFSEEMSNFSHLTTQEGVDLMNKELEKCIMDAPEQYAWEYKKFKHSTLNDPYK